MDSFLDVVRMGEDIPRGGEILHMLVGSACQKIGREAAWDQVELLNAREARAAARRVEDITARHVPFVDVLQEEKWQELAGLMEALGRHSAPVIVNRLLELPPDLEDTERKAHRYVETIRSIGYSNQRVLNDYARYMDQAAAFARLPYAAKTSLPAVPRDPISQRLAPRLETIRFREPQDEVQNALLAVALALRAYRLEHGGYPKALAELVPSYLRKIPDDPFALKGPTRYRRAGDRYLLYSVGPDGIDNGGKPAVAPYAAANAPARERYRVDRDSKGDIVAELNRW